MSRRKTNVWLLAFRFAFLLVLAKPTYGAIQQATLGTLEFHIATTTCTQTHTEKRSKKKTNVWIWKLFVFCCFLWFGQRTVKFNTDFGHAEFSNCHDHVHPSAHRETKQRKTQRTSMDDYLKARKTRDYMGIAEKNLSNLLLFYAGSYPNTNTKTATRSGEEYSSDGKAEKQKIQKKTRNSTKHGRN